MSTHKPILITGVPRSGSSMIAGAVHRCGGYGGAELTKMNSNPHVSSLMSEILSHLKADPGGRFPLPTETRLDKPIKNLSNRLYESVGSPYNTWFVKDSRLLLTWKLWNAAFPDAYWIIVKRKDEDIIQSCMKTHYMNTFLDEAGWQWLIDQYKEKYDQMAYTVKNLYVIHPEKMIVDDYSEFRKGIEWMGLDWNPIVEEYMSKKLHKMKKRYGTNCK
jgi:hypothetical protein